MAELRAGGDLAREYAARVSRGQLQPDPGQQHAIEHLDALARTLEKRERAAKGFLARFFSRGGDEMPTGLYLWGGVGRGKTMLMDMFFQSVSVRHKQRTHFHEFMSRVHDAIKDARARDPGDPIPIVAAEIAQEGNLLCFDELHVTDIADAMILGRLFRALFQNGVVVVATSNAAPRDLYKNGLNRDLFLPFVDLIERHMDVVTFDGAIDYRMEKLAGRELFLVPDDAAAHAAQQAIWQEMTGRGDGAPTHLEVTGRTVAVPEAREGVARFTFADLCEAPLGARDYLAVARRFHTVFVLSIPVLRPAQRDAARRFINLVDALYDNHVSLVATAAAPPEEIYAAGDGVELFARTASRLREMRSAEYLDNRAHRLMAESGRDTGDADAANAREPAPARL